MEFSKSCRYFWLTSQATSNETAKKMCTDAHTHTFSCQKYLENHHDSIALNPSAAFGYAMQKADSIRSDAHCKVPNHDLCQCSMVSNKSRLEDEKAAWSGELGRQPTLHLHLTPTWLQPHLLLMHSSGERVRRGSGGEGCPL